jgi:hypothetical protein
MRVAKMAQTAENTDRKLWLAPAPARAVERLPPKSVPAQDNQKKPNFLWGLDKFHLDAEGYLKKGSDRLSIADLFNRFGSVPNDAPINLVALVDPEWPVVRILDRKIYDRQLLIEGNALKKLLASTAPYPLSPELIKAAGIDPTKKGFNAVASGALDTIFISSLEQSEAEQRNMTPEKMSDFMRKFGF